MQWINSLVNEYEGKPLQKTGMLTKEQLVLFFNKSAEQFGNPEFKELLRLTHKHKRSTEDAVNDMQKSIFEAMGVQGDFGINCLCRVPQVYNNDAFFMRNFYEHVQREEQTLDEAELPEDAFKSKYEQLSKFKAEMEAKMEHMRGLSPEDQQMYMMEVYKDMIARSAPGECCTDPEGCSHRPGGTAAPVGGTAVEAPTARTAAFDAVTTSTTMSEQDQLAFFASLGSKPGGPPAQ